MKKLEFEWDEKKEVSNLKKHGVSFKTATLVFYDDNRLILFDDNNSTEQEERYIAIGRAEEDVVVLFVAFTMRDYAIRIISARKANKREEELYYDC